MISKREPSPGREVTVAVAAVGFGDRLDDRQPEAAARGARRRVTAAGRRAAIEALKDVRGLLGIDAGAGVDHRQDGHPIANADLDA